MESIMYVLVYVMPAQMDGENTVKRVAGKSRKAVMQFVEGDCLAWRLWDGSGWCDGTENAWKWIVNAEGPGIITMD
jgi:hypothetical protein